MIAVIACIGIIALQCSAWLPIISPERSHSHAHESVLPGRVCRGRHARRGRSFRAAYEPSYPTNRYASPFKDNRNRSDNQKRGRCSYPVLCCNKRQLPQISNRARKAPKRSEGRSVWRGDGIHYGEIWWDSGGASKLAKKYSLKFSQFVISEMRNDKHMRFRVLAPGEMLTKHAAKLAGKTLPFSAAGGAR